MRKFFTILGAVAVLAGMAIGGRLIADTGFYLSAPARVFATGQVVYAKDANRLTGSDVLSASNTGMTLGASGTEITQIRVYSQVISPSSVAANTCAEQGFTVTGINTADKVMYNPSGGLSPFASTVRAEATNTVGITFCNVTNGSGTPIPHTATFIAIRS